jgi:tetratricopeptide (TPR) repeat protein
VPISFTDDEINRLRPYRDRDGKIVMVKDLATKDIVETTGDSKPIYFAVTVADYMGYEKRLKLEGLAFKLLDEETKELVDVDETLYNLYHAYRYRGLLKPADENQVAMAPNLEDGPEPIGLAEIEVNQNVVYDTAVYKDLNTRRLVTNYAAAHLRLCIHFIEKRRYQDALRELERAVLVSPNYEGYKDIAIAAYGYAGRTAKAESLANLFLAKEPRNVNLYVQLFNVYRRANDSEGAERALVRMINALPDNPDGYSLLTSLYQETGEIDKAAEVVKRWLSLHPGDRSAAQLLERLEGQPPQEGP